MRHRRSTSRRSRRGISLTGAASLAAIVSVLVLVSLPRLRGFALRENERDAVQTARLMLHALAEDDAPPSLAEVLDDPELTRQLPDSELVEDGRLLRRHGYLFEVVQVGPTELARALHEGGATGTALAAASDGAVVAVRAWPWLSGQTGRAVVFATEHGVLAHSNSARTWSGPACPPALDSSGWRALR